MKAPGVRIDNNWHTLGMRGTGSHDVVFEDVFVADAAISGRRTPAAWHPMFHIVSKHAFPLVFAVYLGVAEAARDRVVEALRKRPADDLALDVLGHIENELAAARLAVADMVEAGAEAAPGFATTHRIMTGRTLAARGVLAVVDLALDAAGGRAYFRSAELERLFRDAQASRYHPLRAPMQRRYAAQMALGIEPTAA
jgi:acyl-CoA dehydrogenase